MADKLSKDFYRDEFACKGENCCNHSAPVHPSLVDALQLLRDRIGKPLQINSGYRCRKRNQEIGGAANSMHCLAIAADVVPPNGMTTGELAAEAENIFAFANGGIGIYDGWVHLDTRNGRKRWDERRKA